MVSLSGIVSSTNKTPKFHCSLILNFMDQPTHENHKNIGTPQIKVISQSQVIGFKCYKKWGAIVFNATFSNISVLLWQPVFLTKQSLSLKHLTSYIEI
jgi:hypothetical protein